MEEYHTNTRNQSGRNMIKYPKTKSDPLCKWRNASIDTVIELVSILPKTRLTKDKFREYMSEFYNGAFLEHLINLHYSLVYIMKMTMSIFHASIMILQKKKKQFHI